MNTSSLSRRLRTHTRDAHARVDALVDGDRIMSHQMSREAYRHLLRVQYRFHGRLEAVVAAEGLAEQWPELAWPQRRKLPWLAADLKALGESTLPELPDFPLPGEQLPGFLYVAEGSTLGGTMLYREMKASPALADTGALRFYQGYGKATGRRWRAFQHWLDALPETMQDEVLAGALAGFTRFEELWQAESV